MVFAELLLNGNMHRWLWAALCQPSMGWSQLPDPSEPDPCLLPWPYQVP